MAATGSYYREYLAGITTREEIKARAIAAKTALANGQETVLVNWTIGGNSFGKQVVRSANEVMDEAVHALLRIDKRFVTKRHASFSF